MDIEKRLEELTRKHYEALVADRDQWKDIFQTVAWNTPEDNFWLEDSAFHGISSNVGDLVIHRYKHVLFQHAEELAREELGLSNNFEPK